MTTTKTQPKRQLDNDDAHASHPSPTATSSSSVPPPPPPPPPNFVTALVAGGMAGTSVDVALFPIDTVKVRLQSPVGFWKAGGFRGIYNGLGAAATGSAPSAALFFATYETCKALWSSQHAHSTDASSSSSLTHMMAASLGEVAACLVRVPTEVVKAKMQTSSTKLPLWQAIGTVWQEGTAAAAASSSTRFHASLAPLTHGLYRGFGMTLFREIPFAMIQFPLYEQFKRSWQDVQHGTPVSPFQAAACGSLSGAIAGAVTTPLDVLKTRTQLGVDRDGIPYRGIRDVWHRTLHVDGPQALWHGLQPRVLWISIGGFVFFGAYEASRTVVGPFLS